MRISIDTDRCIGSAQCAVSVPFVFEQDDDGFSTVIAGREDGAGHPMVREAVRACPVQAITLAETQEA
ncbi:ferredoxin (plasmid) [Streptomyces sp. NBC_00190]|uniref:ferredoxin n=1 Tax=unclassified Streptomyces TaxID=2593676 RepID=UPI002E2C65B2|nr:ferredoxin [Streptomyces sp. NBC_00190]WSZ45678.1 ferredoxin [Streptomyces sp. NBC_00868]